MKRVLFVDDEKALLEMYRDLLSDIAQVNTCHCPLLALDWLRNHEVDLVVFDYQMPRLKGCEFYKQLREFSQVEAICVTGSRNEAEGNGFKVIDKPFLISVFEEQFLK